MQKVLMKGCEAIGEAAIKSGCKYFFGYPITPQNEIPEYMSRRLPQVGGVYLQSESEVAAINMIFGGAGAGIRVMTSSSSPGISLYSEGLSYLAGAGLPCLIINVMRGGPGLGGIQPSQSDYFQATKGGGHGDYRLIVFAPSTVQEAVDLVSKAFDLADKYRNPAMILADGIIGQMMEPVIFPETKPKEYDKSWATTGRQGKRPQNIVKSLLLNPEELEKWNWELKRKYDTIRETEQMAEEYMLDDADYMIAAYGTTARICRTSIQQLRDEGYKVGMLRPITLFPFPDKFFARYMGKIKFIFDVEMSTGQMIEDVKLSTLCRIPVHFHGRTGGMVPSPEEIAEKFKELVAKEK
jgi:2-oxoglutarate ferredoxin oxidoreductase subunit alpha